MGKEHHGDVYEYAEEDEGGGGEQSCVAVGGGRHDDHAVFPGEGCGRGRRKKNRNDLVVFIHNDRTDVCAVEAVKVRLANRNTVVHIERDGRSTWQSRELYRITFFWWRY